MFPGLRVLEFWSLMLNIFFFIISYLVKLSSWHLFCIFLENHLFWTKYFLLESHLPWEAHLQKGLWVLSWHSLFQLTLLHLQPKILPTTFNSDESSVSICYLSVVQREKKQINNCSVLFMNLEDVIRHTPFWSWVSNIPHVYYVCRVIRWWQLWSPRHDFKWRHVFLL